MIPITSKVREYLEKNIAEDIPWQYDPEYVFAKERALYWNNKVSKLSASLVANCNHSIKEVESQYWEGSYLERARTDYTVKCKKCGIKLFEDTEMHD